MAVGKPTNVPKPNVVSMPIGGGNLTFTLVHSKNSIIVFLKGNPTCQGGSFIGSKTGIVKIKGNEINLMPYKVLEKFWDIIRIVY